MDVEIRSGAIVLPGEMVVPEDPKGIVLFAHGSGSSRFSPRNRRVGRALNAQGLGTLLFDLLTPEESLDRENVFDIGLLAERLKLASDWLRFSLTGIPIGYFGASTGAAAALWAAADEGDQISAVVSRGGRPDLAMARLAHVTAPTLLIVGGNDELVLELNRRAAARIPACEMSVVPGATHLFEEPGALEEVSDLAADWVARQMGRAAAAAASWVLMAVSVAPARPGRVWPRPLASARR